MKTFKLYTGIHTKDTVKLYLVIANNIKEAMKLIPSSEEISSIFLAEDQSRAEAWEVGSHRFTFKKD